MAPHMVEVLMPTVTHYKKLNKSKVKSMLLDIVIGQLTLLRNNTDLRIIQI